ncbi:MULTISPECIES: hypothetical protein [Pseudomonas]|uniref:hypothetical protein n=1 Tax=Pseudomonas TaxID=286 RepID=UPI0008A1BB79|nr:MULTISPECIES: hypothetical protein [Pseudomonas]OFR58463.1 hypothetical protein HMPREF2886_32155 [Pseudomonas sp. HMSC066A08]RUE48545.1 hypothetical protein IPC1224_29765 [Pseudomonas aeruginosa]GLF59343.1 hypothetical protein VNPA141826_35040 [Pseudomonas aeruginosa]GLF78919.1 hypothetical protein VNPA152081_39920 [Pseudomonas aeruginosa]
MSRYNRILYIIVGTHGHHEWDEFATAIQGMALSDKGRAYPVDRSNHSSLPQMLEGYNNPKYPKAIALLKLEIEEVIGGADFAFVSDYVWATHNCGNPGKVVLLGHGSLLAEIGAYADLQKTSYLQVAQRTFIETVFPDWPPAQPANLPPNPDGNRLGLKTVALKQCYAARTLLAYVNKDPSGNSHSAAAGSAADITAQTLRDKGWGGTGMTLTASPEYNIFSPDSAEIRMSTQMPIVEGGSSGQTITFPGSHTVTTDSGAAHVKTRLRVFTPDGTATKKNGDDYWKADAASSVLYPSHWIRTYSFPYWRIYLPEYVTANPSANSITCVAPGNALHLKKTELKVRIVL